MNALVRGGLAGLAATVPMTAVIAAGRAAGWLYTPPPVQITETLAEQAGADPDPRSPAFQAGWMTAHAGYGVACGTLYALVRPRLPRSGSVAGLLFGAAVWGVSYLGLMPALDLFPPATRDAPRRQAVMIVAHAIFGLALATAEQALQRTGARGPGGASDLSDGSPDSGPADERSGHPHRGSH